MLSLISGNFSRYAIFSSMFLMSIDGDRSMMFFVSSEKSMGFFLWFSPLSMFINLFGLVSSVFCVFFCFFSVVKVFSALITLYNVIKIIYIGG